MGCTNNGKYIFTLKAYRECAGITYANTQTINSNSSAGNFTVTLQSGYPKDISPVCNSNPAFSHIACATTTVSNTGGVSEYVYKSSALTLNGVPPVSGWIFTWEDCCRNPCANITGSINLGWRLRAIMYPYNNTNANPCYDNSPVFAEIPRTVICSGYPFTYNHNAFDKELDSLSFAWGQPLLDNGSPVTSYASGYSYTNPLPGPSQNPNNVSGTVNPINGEISFTSFTTGAYVTSVKVTAWKCHIKVAEIWRDIQVVILPCGTNTPPVVPAPFPMNPNPYLDTVYAGDTVHFSLAATDFQFLPNGTPQTVSIEASG